MEEEIIDITRPIHEGMAIYPNNPAVSFENVSEGDGENYGLSQITLGSHTGTHIDAPSHIEKDAGGIDLLSLDAMIGDAEVVELGDVSDVITAHNFSDTASDRILIKTSSSQLDVDEFDEKFVALDESAARLLVERGIKLVGIDSPSIKKKGVKDKVHKILMDAGVVIVEGLWLKDVKPGSYELICLPLSLVGLDGAPVRVALKTNS